MPAGLAGVHRVQSDAEGDFALHPPSLGPTLVSPTVFGNP